ncbi:MAG: flagellar basal body P-ring formation chaperone FlgA [Planctomycetota bacterium]
MMLATLLLAFGGVTVNMPAKVEGQGVDLRLGDVATVTGDDAQMVEKVEGLNLGYMPAPGYSRLLQREQLRTALLQVYPDLQVSFQGEARVRVFPKVQLVTAAEIEKAAREVIEKKFHGADVECTLRDKLVNLTVPLGRKQVEVRARAATGPEGQGSQGVPVDILVDGDLWRTQWTSWNVEAWEQVPVLTQPIARGSKLRPAMFRMERRRRSLINGLAPLLPAQIQEAQATRDLQPGSPVFPNDVERALVVRINNLVKVDIVAGRVSASCNAQALEDGHMGDVIRVRLETTGKEVLGNVAGPNRIEINLR